MYREPKDQRINGRVGKLLCHQRPDAKPGISHAKPQKCGEQRTAQRCKEKAFEHHIAGHIGLLDAFDTGKHQRQAGNANHGRQRRIFIECRNIRCRNEHSDIQHQTHRKIEIEYR